MRILFTTGSYYLPQGIGGIQRNTDDLAHTLKDLYCEPSVISGIRKGDLWFYINSLQRKISRSPLASDTNCGYTVFRGWNLIDGLDELLDKAKTDCIIVQSNNMAAFAEVAKQHGVPVFAYFHATDLYDIDPANPPAFDGVFSNSIFTYNWVKKSLGYQSLVIPPLVIPSKYLTNTSRSNVLFFNPHPWKGGNLVIDIARKLTHIRFDFVSSWVDDPEILKVRQAASTLNNITWHKATADIRPHLAKARLVLLPSQIDETWGRVASESQVCGIPVIGADRGGIPEAIGIGGILLQTDAPVDAWCAVINQLFTDTVLYEKLSFAALTHSKREYFQPSFIISSLLNAIGKSN